VLFYNKLIKNIMLIANSINITIIRILDKISKALLLVDFEYFNKLIKKNKDSNIIIIFMKKNK
jgi:hypothetical protein